MSMENRRLHLLDELRGLLMGCVVLYHLGYDLTVLFGVEMPWFWGMPVRIFRDCGAGALMILSGISCSLSRSNLRRGVRTLLVALALSAVTFAVMPEERILFGILHYFAFCTLLWALIGKTVEKVPIIVGLPLAALLFAVTQPLPEGALLLPFWGRVALPTALYQSHWLFALGLPHPTFFSADYYPLIPWGFLFLAGGMIGAACRRTGFPQGFYRRRWAAADFFGRHSLWIYLLHQPILVVLLGLGFRLFAA